MRVLRDHQLPNGFDLAAAITLTRVAVAAGSTIPGAFLIGTRTLGLGQTAFRADILNDGLAGSLSQPDFLDLHRPALAGRTINQTRN